MIPFDTEIRFDQDCSTCSHRVERHPSRRTNSSRPIKLKYVCLVTGRPIGEHGTWMHTVSDPKTGRAFGGPERWVQDIPCRALDRNTGKWIALDYDPSDST